MRIAHLCVLALLLGTIVVQAAPVVKPVVAPVVAEPLVEKDGLKVSIGSIELRASDPHINVVLQNTLAKPINVYAEWNSWGYDNLTLQITKLDGKVLDEPLIINKGLMAWSRNGPTTEGIAPGEAIVREVRLDSPDQQSPIRNGPFYLGFPLPPQGASRQISMRAVFENEQNVTLGQEKKLVWTGRIASPFKDYDVRWTSN